MKYQIKKHLKGATLLMEGGALLEFPKSGNPYNEAFCKKHPQYFECISNPKPSRGKAPKAKSGSGGSDLHGEQMDSMG